MTEFSTWADSLLDEDQKPVLPRRKMDDSDEMDITPMIDVTFLLLIYFIVASVPDSATAVALPPARFGVSVSEKYSVILTIGEGGRGAAPVYLADGRIAAAQLSENPEKQVDEIRKAVQDGMNEDKPNVLIKAERGVAHREVARVAAAASQVPGIQLHLAVLEAD